jgi:hypothetical protein
MSQNPNKQNTNSPQRDETASTIAVIFNKTPRLVRMVMEGKVNNESILEAAILYKEGKSKLIQEIEKLVPLK